MVHHLFPRFLDDVDVYHRAVDYWKQLWEQVDPVERQRAGWRHPWLSTTWGNGVECRDGNPIFSVYSPQLQKGIRVIQHEITSDRLEINWWLDTFGGPITEPEAIRELVIACALSDEASDEALRLMRTWVAGELDAKASPALTSAAHAQGE